MKRGKSKLLAGLLSVAMAFSVIAVPVESFAATDTSGHWAEASINNWINSGYINGYPDGTFRPNNPISRAEFVTIANKAFGFTSSQGISFNDVIPGYWAYGEIQKGVAAGYIQGDTENTFRPGSAVTRQEAAVMLARLRGYSNDEAGAYNYNDRWAMANWAVGAIGAVSRNGVMSGYPDGTFRPQQSLTRAEAVASLQKIANSSNSFTSANTSTNTYTPSTSVNTDVNNTSIINNTNNTISNSVSSDEPMVLEGTRLENRTLTRDLQIPRSVGSQNVTLKNIRMKGTLYVDGGGNITLENCNIANVVMRRNNAVLKNNGSSEVGEVRFEENGRIDGKGYENVLIDDDSVSEVIIDADVDTLTLDAEVDLKLYANANIDTFEITKNADKAKIKIGEDAQVSDMQVYDKVRISGKGKVDVMTVYVSGVRSEIEPRRLIQQDNAKKPNFSYKDDDDDDDDDYDNLTLDEDDEDYDGDDEKVNRLRIAAEDVRVRDLTVYDDLTITSAAGDSTIRLDDVTVRGNVYIEGGGDSSVIFDDCTINGNIYSRKNTSGRYDEAVAIKLRSTSVKGDIFVTGDTILESNSKLKRVTLNRELSRTFRMDADAENLIINYNNTVQMRGSHTIDSVEVASGLNNVTITMEGGKFGTLTARSPIRIDGTGTIDKLLTDTTNDIGSGITIGSTGSVGDGTTTPSGSYTITAAVSGENGTITPSGQQTVVNGGSREFTITANNGYHVAAIIVDNSEVYLSGKLYQSYTYTFNNVNANHSITVSFAQGAGTDGNGSANNGSTITNPSGDYTITTNISGTGGSADNLLLSVKDGENASITFTADNDYHISQIVIDEGTDTEQNLKRISDSDVTYKKVTYTFVNVIKNHTISVKFEQGEGTNEIGILSTDEDSAVIKPSGYKYDIKTELFNGTTNKPLDKNEDGRYYCIAGDAVILRMLSFETDDPNKEYLQTKWAVVNNTTNMEMDLTQRDGETIATLQTKAGSGYAAILKVQVYDTSRESTIPVASSDVAELHVDVPLEDLQLNSLNCQGNQFSLSPQNLVFIPATASAANNKQNITWKVVRSEIEPVVEPLVASGEPDVKIVEISDGKDGTIPNLRVEQHYKETQESQTEKLVAQPIGKVKIEATIPNGRGNMQPYTQMFDIEFVGTKVIPVKSVTIEASDKQAPKIIYGIDQLDLTKIGVQIIPSDATYKTVEWKIEKQGSLSDDLTNSGGSGEGDLDDSNASTLDLGDTKGNIKTDSENRNTILETTGYPGTIILEPYIKNGLEIGKDFDVTDPQERITVKVATIAPVVSANNIGSTNGTDENDTITLSARVTNADKTPYTEIKGWLKSYDGTTWTEENIIEKGSQPGQITFDAAPSADGTYTARYVVSEDDLNEDSSYNDSIVYFRAYTEYDKVDNAVEAIEEEGAKVDSDIVSVNCHAQEIVFPTRTDSNGNITSSGNGTQKTYTITGYDKVTLDSELKNHTSITWSIPESVKSAGIAQLDGNVLTVKGKPNGEFVLTATVDKKGPTTFNIKTAFQAIDVKSSKIAVRDEQNVNITEPIRTGTKIYFKQIEVSPVYATYNDESIAIKDKLSWRVKNGNNTVNVEANEYGIGEYEVPPNTTGTLSITALWQNAVAQGNDVSAVLSNPIEIQIIDDIIPVTGLDFSKTYLKDLQPTIADNKYSYTIPSVNERIQISLDGIKVLPSDATNQDVAWTTPAGTSIPENVAKLESNILTIENTTIGDTITLNARVEKGKSETEDYTATLELIIPKGSNAPTDSTGTGDNTDSNGTTPPTTGTGQQSEATASEEPASTFNVLPPTSVDVPEENNSISENESMINTITDNIITDDTTTNTETVNKEPTNEENNVSNEADSTENKEISETNTTVNGIIPVTDIDFSRISSLKPSTTVPSLYTTTSIQGTIKTISLNEAISAVNGQSMRTGAIVVPDNATNKNVIWTVKPGTLTTPSNTAGVVNITGIGHFNQNSNVLTIASGVFGTVTLVATVPNGKAQNENFVKELTIQIQSPNGTVQNTQNTTNAITSNTNNTTPSQSTTNNTVSMPSNTTQANSRQIISVGTTSVGTSSVTSAGTSSTKEATKITESPKNTISNSDVKIEVSGQCKKGISVSLKAVSKSTQKEYTDVEWEITNDSGTKSKLDGNRLRASNTGTVTVTATIYTESGVMESSTSIKITN